MSELTTSDRIASIRTAIARVKESRERFREATVGPSMDSVYMEYVRDSFTAALKEFGWQYYNVEAVLAVLAPEEIGRNFYGKSHA